MAWNFEPPQASSLQDREVLKHGNHLEGKRIGLMITRRLSLPGPGQGFKKRRCRSPGLCHSGGFEICVEGCPGMVFPQPGH